MVGGGSGERQEPKVAWPGMGKPHRRADVQAESGGRLRTRQAGKDEGVCSGQEHLRRQRPRDGKETARLLENPGALL